MRHIIRSATIIAAAASVALPAIAHGQRDGRDGRSRIDTTFAFSKGGSLDLRLFSGDIVVTGWSRSEMKIVAGIERGAIDAALNNSRVSLNARGNRGGMGEAHFEVMVPFGTQVQTNSISGDTRVTGTAGEVQITSVNGDIAVSDAINRVTVQTVSGNVRANKLRGRTRIETTSGDLEIDDVLGELAAHTVSGEIVMQHMQLTQLVTETTSGDVSYSGSIDPKGSYELSAHSGDVRLEIPANTSARFDLQTFNGEISSRFPVTIAPGFSADRTNFRNSRKMQFTIGGGGAHITIETFSGDISIGHSTSFKKDN